MYTDQVPCPGLTSNLLSSLPAACFFPLIFLPYLYSFKGEDFLTAFFKKYLKLFIYMYIYEYVCVTGKNMKQNIDIKSSSLILL